MAAMEKYSVFKCSAKKKCVVLGLMYVLKCYDFNFDVLI